MSLINCKECGKEISNTAKSCPHCGFEINKNQTTKLLIGLATIFLIGIGGFYAYQNLGDNSQIEKAVKAALTDPDSAKISKVIKGVENDISCGLVNAKNNFGAYVGDTPFIYNNDTYQVEFISLEKVTDYDFQKYAESVNTETFQQEYEALKGKCLSVDNYSKKCFGVEDAFDNHPYAPR